MVVGDSACDRSKRRLASLVAHRGPLCNWHIISDAVLNLYMIICHTNPWLHSYAWWVHETRCWMSHSSERSNSTYLLGEHAMKYYVWCSLQMLIDYLKINNCNCINTGYSLWFVAMLLEIMDLCITHMDCTPGQYSTVPYIIMNTLHTACIKSIFCLKFLMQLTWSMPLSWWNISLPASVILWAIGTYSATWMANGCHARRTDTFAWINLVSYNSPLNNWQRCYKKL